ncbi:hypothetical protein [uncultured phage MedDCM-OCT-S08-C304]|nr:hypothetical protein [uncultured phage MedDCM-OCT-S08-C304]
MKLLIDCDYIVYKCCASTETEIDFGDDVILVTSLFSEAYKCVERELDKVKREFPFYDEIILFFTSPNNFRKKSYRVTKVIEIEKSPVDSKESYRN